MVRPTEVPSTVIPSGQTVKQWNSETVKRELAARGGLGLGGEGSMPITPDSIFGWLVLRFTHPLHVSMYNPRMSTAIRDQKLRIPLDVLGGGEVR